MKANVTTDRQSYTNLKRSKIAIAVTSIALSLGLFVCLFVGLHEGTGTRADFLANRADQKSDGHVFGQKGRKIEN